MATVATVAFSFKEILIFPIIFLTFAPRKSFFKQFKLKG